LAKLDDQQASRMYQSPYHQHRGTGALGGGGCFLFFETGYHYVAMVGFKLRDSPISTFQVLGFKVWATVPSFEIIVLFCFVLFFKVKFLWVTEPWVS
jgi:hypothetical protein